MTSPTHFWPLLILAGIGCSGDLTSSPKEAAKDESELQKQAEPVYEALAQIADNFPDMAALEPQKCDSKSGVATQISWGTLHKIIGQDVPELDQELSFLSSTADDTFRLANLPGKGTTQKYPNASNYTDVIEKFSSSWTHIEVTRFSDGQAPELRDSSSFTPGHAKGWLVVFEINSRQPICHWPIEANMTSTIEARKYANSDHSSAGAARQALTDNMESSLRESLRLAKSELYPD